MNTFLGSLLLAASFTGTSAAGPVKPVAHVDLERYAGRWYEQARFPMYFQRKCASDTQAEYAILPDGRVSVSNSCKTKAGETIESEGIARKVDGSTSTLEVRFAPAFLSFLPVVWGDYWIIGLDPDYRWAVVGAPNRKYLWILSREKALSAEDLEQAKRVASEQGFDLSKLVYTPHD